MTGSRHGGEGTGDRADTVIHGGTVITPEGRLAADVAVTDGRIAGLFAPGTAPPARARIDATGRWVIPGALDVHVHFREPGLSHKETWTSATRAAAAGGVTTVLDMPNTDPPTVSARAIAEKRAIAARQAIVDFGLYGALDERSLPEIAAMVREGATSFKLYMGSENALVPCPSDGAIVEGFEALADMGIRCTVHAENTPILAWRGARLQAAGRTDLAAHLEQHVDLAEVEGVSRTALFAQWTGCKVHVAHVSSRHSLPLIARAKADGIDLTAETCPHYLYLSTDDAARLGGNALRVKPPVREPGHAEPLWQALASGVIDILSTDHAPHLPEEKGRDDIWRTAPGFPGVETSMRLMLTAVAQGRLRPEDYVRMACAAPARAFGLYPRKGAIAVGSDADIVLVDPHRRAPIRAAALHSIGAVTPFDGIETTGAPVMTMVRGRVVMRDGIVEGAPGWGRCLAEATS